MTKSRAYTGEITNAQSMLWIVGTRIEVLKPRLPSLFIPWVLIDSRESSNNVLLSTVYAQNGAQQYEQEGGAQQFNPTPQTPVCPIPECRSGDPC